jgi:hypothetical protein
MLSLRHRSQPLANAVASILKEPDQRANPVPAISHSFQISAAGIGMSFLSLIQFTKLVADEGHSNTQLVRPIQVLFDDSHGASFDERFSEPVLSVGFKIGVAHDRQTEADTNRGAHGSLAPVNFTPIVSMMAAARVAIRASQIASRVFR